MMCRRAARLAHLPTGRYFPGPAVFTRRRRSTRLGFDINLDTLALWSYKTCYRLRRERVGPRILRKSEPGMVGSPARCTARRSSPSRRSQSEGLRKRPGVSRVGRVRPLQRERAGPGRRQIPGKWGGTARVSDLGSRPRRERSLAKLRPAGAGASCVRRLVSYVVRAGKAAGQLPGARG